MMTSSIALAEEVQPFLALNFNFTVHQNVFLPSISPPLADPNIP